MADRIFPRHDGEAAHDSDRHYLSLTSFRYSSASLYDLGPLPGFAILTVNDIDQNLMSQAKNKVLEENHLRDRGSNLSGLRVPCCQPASCKTCKSRYFSS